MSHVTRQIERSFDLYDDLLGSLSEQHLNQKLPVPSNLIWDQLWCVVGVRESVTTALKAGEWQGFSCSLGKEDRAFREPLEAAISRSRIEAGAAISAHPDNALTLDLLVHEAQHQGQLIRYLYGLRLDIPGSWQKRWSL